MQVGPEDGGDMSYLTCVDTQICSVMFGARYTYILGDGARRVVCVQSMQGACHLACVYTQMCSVLLCLLDAFVCY